MACFALMTVVWVAVYVVAVAFIAAFGEALLCLFYVVISEFRVRDY